MTDDPVKFPRAKPLPPRREIDVLIDRLEHYMRFSVTDEAKLRYARELVDARHQRGDYHEIQDMDAATREAMARMMVGEMEAERG